MHDATILTGEVTDIFAHRFVLKTGTGTVLADLGPDGARQVSLRRGDRVEIEGERKPSEIKVREIRIRGAVAGDRTVLIERGGHADADPSAALATVVANGYTPVGTPRRKPKHFEIIGRKDGRLTELHVEPDGHLRKAKPIAADDATWSAESRVR